MPDVVVLFDLYGEALTICLVGGVIGVLFGAFAQHSAFCLRSAAIEVARGRPGQGAAVWLLAFAVAVFGTQALAMAGLLDPSALRTLAEPASLSGALVGGIVFGVGMVLARGCPSRLIVLAASGNLRAAVTLLILALVVLATLSGALVPARQVITPVAMLSPAEQSAFLSVSATAVLAVIGALMIGAIVFARKVVGRLTYALAAIGTGLTIPLAWFLTAAISQQTFDPFEPQAVSYAAPTAMAVAGLVDLENATPSYGLGLLGGAFVGAFLIAVATGSFRVVQFTEGATLPRYAAGAVLMGFGSVLCLGCAVGAGMTGASVLATHALVALASMVFGAGVADWAERGIAAARARRSTPLDDLYPARQQTTRPSSGLVAAE